MSYRRKKQKPMFKKKKSPWRTTLKVLLVLLLATVLVFLGYSIGKPVLEFFDNLNSQNQPDVPDLPDLSDSDILDNSDQSDLPDSDDELVDEQPDSPDDEPAVIKSGILYLSLDGETDILSLVEQAVQTAVKNNCKGICLELVSEGGTVNYQSENELACDSDAVKENAPELSQLVDIIKQNDLQPYAYVSALSDHAASWYDRSICYLFADGSSKWLDNSISNGGKPWISPFSDNAKEYIGSLVKEISDAGFVGLTAGDFCFPPFRTKDLSYVGEIVQNPDRYIALCQFSDAISSSADFSEFYAVWVDALDVLEGNCELLADPAIVNADVVYVKYSSDIGTRIEKADGSVVSLEGLDEQYKLAQVYRLVLAQLSDSGLNILPAVDSALEYSAVVEILESLGFDTANAIVY